ncbi:hypothetical protein [Nannocystis sp. SCPEA4]|uniref:hypothetical protein n=1 Tax=Nannocystis sp. SCPEA4 TaxID=2996787 RepID=UPI0022714C20|nr:hypothetical protein [Nannocystis sp. SCPEA4]MCY1054432.1 hypothetical protein [Nannocystis sp. SCPEA4]
MNPRFSLHAWVLALAGCAGDGSGIVGSGEPAPDWKLVDVNPDSATHEQARGPSDYAGSVSGWYFAHAT